MSGKTLAQSFAPEAGAQPHVLLLGSMPGQASLQATEYYAHPRNGFWPIVLSAINGSPPSYQQAQQVAYAERLQLATAAGFALWDVLAECSRHGSLDSNIERSSEVVNPILEWLETQPSVKRVCFNGQTSAAVFKRHLGKAAAANDHLRDVLYTTLPSTSPAHASMSLDEKAAAWLPALRP